MYSIMYKHFLWNFSFSCVFVDGGAYFRIGQNTFHTLCMRRASPRCGSARASCGWIVGRCSCAGPALVRFLASVNPEVCAQSGLLGKGLAANGTLMRPDARVGGHVIVQVGVSSVGLPAHRTMVFGWFKLDGRRHNDSRRHGLGL